jgi:hypothetical protein
LPLIKVELKALKSPSTLRLSRSRPNLRDCGSLRRKIVVPICKGDDSIVYKKISVRGIISLATHPTIVNVIQVLLGIIWIIDDQGSTQAVTVLVPEVAVIPVCSLEGPKVS